MGTNKILCIIHDTKINMQHVFHYALVSRSNLLQIYFFCLECLSRIQRNPVYYIQIISVCIMFEGLIQVINQIKFFSEVVFFLKSKHGFLIHWCFSHIMSYPLSINKSLLRNIEKNRKTKQN